MAKPFHFVLLIVLTGVCITAGATVWHFWTTRASYLFEQGRKAVAEGDWNEADRIAKDLDKSGEVDHGHFLRGELWVNRGRSSLHQIDPMSKQGPFGRK